MNQTRWRQQGQVFVLFSQGVRQSVWKVWPHLSFNPDSLLYSSWQIEHPLTCSTGYSCWISWVVAGTKLGCPIRDWRSCWRPLPSMIRFTELIIWLRLFTFKFICTTFIWEVSREPVFHGKGGHWNPCWLPAGTVKLFALFWGTYLTFCSEWGIW